jgi:hypothetical protein
MSIHAWKKKTKGMPFVKELPATSLVKEPARTKTKLQAAVTDPMASLKKILTGLKVFPRTQTNSIKLTTVT